MPRTIEYRYGVDAETILMPGFDAEDIDYAQRFQAKGTRTRTIHQTPDMGTNGLDFSAKRFEGVIGIIPNEPPIFYLETELPEELRMEKEATLADAISFSSKELLGSLIKESIKRTLNREEVYGRS